MSHVFLSYSHADDQDFIGELESLLERSGFVAWTDRDLKAGDFWRKEIDLAIQEAFALAVVITPAALNSPYVTYEWAYAMGLGVPIVPILLHEAPLHPKLEELQYLDFRDDDLTQPLKELQDRLNELERTYLPKALKKRQARIRIKAVKRVGELKMAEAVPQLIHLLQNDPSLKQIRPAVIKALETIGTPEALAAVEKWHKTSPS